MAATLADSIQRAGHVVDWADDLYKNACRMRKSHQLQDTSHGRWRYLLYYLGAAINHIGYSDQLRDVYQFGVHYGNSMGWLRDLFPQNRLIGFDSFTGLPEESDDVPRFHSWRAGHLAVEDPVGVRTKIVEDLGGPDRAVLVPGFFNESLTVDLPQKLSLFPAAYIDIDVDLYISAFQALDWIFARGLVREGTLIGYDDWWAFACVTNTTDVLDSGVARAHREITNKYSIQFKCVAGACHAPKNWGVRRGSCDVHDVHSSGPVFLLMEVGSASGGNTGFAMTPMDIKKFKAINRDCKQFKVDRYWTQDSVD